ncbi:sulfonate transport system substrate-binding protein [Herbaspirillum sp. Sphag1AN]|uniref:aliphatic sulfonate ABC transporter substrate-binding protein n=1 Tax=unclassified Herbaspirillum TaxID=2624150 RepID=UPI001619032B|nr:MULTISPECIES: aliphatic sulfonate ABC transporter substrate-binding protein [unclassified Herbaspirillum]MBB3214700.1 sulfonate transport system substrate-binding protein [Herbaspirillum sp. Sphag1AN]MBB3247897.1 sulfonate transport system substrate-binding protein [Herbaspirillum sp. Sphag64]
MSFSRLQKRRHVLSTLTRSILGLGLLTSGVGYAAEEQTLRIGYQKSSTLVILLKSNGVLEKRLGKLGIKISWHEFTSGLPLLEALNIGNIDISADVADTVPVFALAAGAKLIYLAQEAPSPSAQALLVRADSPIKTIADLKGRRIGVTKAAGSHYLLIALLESVGLKFKDIEPAYLTPADGRAAFEKGAIDAWVIWDPFLATAQRQGKVRIVADGKNNIASYQRYYLASASYAQGHPDVLNAVFEELRGAGQWVRANPRVAAELLAPIWGLDADTVELANSRRSYEVRSIGAASLSEQQSIADAFLAQGVLPHKVNIGDIGIWKP